MKTSILAIFFLTTVVWAQNQADPNDPNNIEELKRQGRIDKRINMVQVKEIEKLKTDNKQLTSRVKFLEQLCIKLGYTPAETNKELKNQIKAASKIIKDRFDAPFKVGQVARLGGNSLKVIQIQDSNNILAHFLISSERIVRENRSGTRSFDPSLISVSGLSLGDGKKGRIEHIYPEQSEKIWLKGISTSGLATNSKIDVGGIQKITGTKKIDGGDTVFVFEPVNYVE